MTLPIATERPAALSRELRKAEDPFLARRRDVVALSFVSAAAMLMVGLYQIGLLRHLPEPPLPGLDPDRVDASAGGDAFMGGTAMETSGQRRLPHPCHLPPQGAIRQWLS